MQKPKKEKNTPNKNAMKICKKKKKTMKKKAFFCIILRNNLAVYCKTVAIRPVNM